ncbi:hypothetical protein [Deinococcus alpinitundrae]|nr:hypothetical protein [Deinococcus alpinitundrae]
MQVTVQVQPRPPVQVGVSASARPPVSIAVTATPPSAPTDWTLSQW